MEERKKVTFSDIRVGVFVIATTFLLALGIFLIGSQVGLFEDTFIAKTYLNNVSGLKPGDIVLLGGVEIGNVLSVDIEPAERMPDTDENARTQLRLQVLVNEERQFLQARAAANNQLLELRRQYAEAVAAAGASSGEAAQLAGQVTQAEIASAAIDASVVRTQERIQRERNSLQNIVVRLRLLAAYRSWIRADSYISLGSVGLLGDKYVEISLGRTTVPPTTEPEMVAGWIGASEEQVVLITGRPQSGFEELITGANDILVNFETLSSKLQEILVKLDQGEGTVGKFLNDSSFYDNLNSTVVSARVAVDQAAKVMTDIREGTGTIPALIQERGVYDKLDASITRLEQVLSKVDEGEGAMGRFVNDPALYDNANKVMANVDGITERMKNGEGTLGKLSTDAQLYEDMRRALDQVAGFVEEIEQGKGTLGRLAKDEQLYNNVNEVSSEVVKLLYDFRQNPKKFLTINFKLF